ncbi:hypothetical protein P9452_01940 [Bacillus mycoides]|uniref:hypothetical protein n=1 Tax=Bacillus mycoides TaxID=1405 RepID=UPI002E1C3711|nr:hypothetical protein [Bacillus mycoides]
MLAPFYRDTMQETVDKHTSGGKVLDETVKSIIELEYKREAFKPYNKIKEINRKRGN